MKGPPIIIKIHSKPIRLLVQKHDRAGDRQGEAAPAGDYVFLAEMTQGEISKQIPVLAEAKVKGVSWNDEIGQVLLEIADGQAVPLSEIKRILD